MVGGDVVIRDAVCRVCPEQHGRGECRQRSDDVARFHNRGLVQLLEDEVLHGHSAASVLKRDAEGVLPLREREFDRRCILPFAHGVWHTHVDWSF